MVAFSFFQFEADELQHCWFYHLRGVTLRIFCLNLYVCQFSVGINWWRTVLNFKINFALSEFLGLLVGCLATREQVLFV